MKKIIMIIYMLLIIILYGCIDSVVKLEGRVVSNITGEPIVDAKIKLKYANIIVTTDSLGYFNLTYICGISEKKEFLITKKGYKDFEIEVDYKHPQMIYKISNESYYYDLKNSNQLCPDTITSANVWLTTISFDKYSKDFAIKKDSLIVYLDFDLGIDGEFENYLKQHKHHKFKIINK
jgi:hypothetical protein